MNANPISARHSPPAWRLVLILTGASMPLAEFALAECPADGIGIHAKESAGTVELHAVNSTELPISITLNVWTRHMAADRARTVTETVALARRDHEFSESAIG